MGKLLVYDGRILNHLQAEYQILRDFESGSVLVKILT